MTAIQRRLATGMLAALAAFGCSPAARADVPADYRAAVLADAPLAYWTLDEASGTVAADHSPNGRTGTLAGGVTLGAAAPFSSPANTAAVLDATGTLTAQVPGTARLVEFWVRPSQRVQQTFVTFGNPAASGWSVGLSGSRTSRSQRRRLVFTSGGRVVSSRVTLAIGAWSMVSVSWGPGSLIRFTVNGRSVTRNAWYSVIPPSTNALSTFKAGPGAGTGDTAVDEVALYASRPDAKAHYAQSALPVLVAAPAVTQPGAPAVGTPITATPGSWGPGTTVTDEWQRCDAIGACQAIPGATGTTYVPAPEDAGFTIQLQETAVTPTGTIVVYSDATEPVANADGSQPAATPLLPPGADPAVPAAETEAAIAAGGVIAEDPDVVTQDAAAEPPAPGAAGASPAAAPSGERVARACIARALPVRAKRLKLRRMGRRGTVTVRMDATTSVVTVRAARGVVRRVRWSLDGRALAAGRGTALRLPALASGDHVLHGRVARRHGRTAPVTLRFSTAC